jgi:hypothetical protein
MKPVVVAVLLVAACVGASASALASPRRLSVLPATVSRGAVVHVTGNASPCRTGNTVYAISRAFPGKAFGGEGALAGRVGAGGAFSITGHIRRALKPGRYTVGARCGGGNLGVSAAIRVR